MDRLSSSWLRYSLIGTKVHEYKRIAPLITVFESLFVQWRN